jgi:UDP-3-O-[3-hydroxymyristoyl] N-acetylglucosamine deacetylase/3-hydroxyacyl-[acyl-carrier-protein] dehydratase
MDKQKTIAKAAVLSGIGLHTGNKVKIKFKPAPENSGINFLRSDILNSPPIKATIDMLLPIFRNPRRTSIGKGEVEVHTIEHLMAVLAGLQIDNLSIELDNNEVPGIDGSGKAFCDALTKAGIREQSAPKRHFLVKETLSVEEEGAVLAVLPSKEFKISYTLDYDHPQLKAQFLELSIDEKVFKEDLVTSRTFCLAEETNGLIKSGLGKGANYNNTLVVGKTGVIKNELRFDDEFVRHKVLDLIGDLYLLGTSIKGHFIAVRSGHALNLKLLNKIKRQRDSYAFIKAADIHSKKEGELDIEDIKRILPHREPFLFVDKILSLEKGKRAVGLKRLTRNDYFFKGHFPSRPIMPGVLIIEAMAQVGGVMMLSAKENLGKLAYFLACDNVKFRKTVLPGDELIMEVNVEKLKSRTGKLKANAFVNGKLVAEADLMFTLVD